MVPGATATRSRTGLPQRGSSGSRALFAVEKGVGETRGSVWGRMAQRAVWWSCARISVVVFAVTPDGPTIHAKTCPVCGAVRCLCMNPRSVRALALTTTAFGVVLGGAGSAAAGGIGDLLSPAFGTACANHGVGGQAAGEARGGSGHVDGNTVGVPLANALNQCGGADLPGQDAVINLARPDSAQNLAMGTLTPKPASDSYVDFVIGQASVELTNLFNGDQALGQALGGFLGSSGGLR